jgi:NADPH:quinone reductase-like Zn-dependent oxidoreductase
VRAAGANQADWTIRSGRLRLVSGHRFPRGLGHDFAGVVDAIGPQTSLHRVGDEVYGIRSIRQAGAFSEYLVVDEKKAFPKPSALSFELAAALPMPGVTAWSAVHDKARLQAGQSVFVTGCLGGVGRAATQLALMRGAEVAGNCSASTRDEALGLGVGEVADYRDFDPAAHRGRFDVVVDTATSLTMSECARMLRPGGVAVHVAPYKLPACLVRRRHRVAAGSPTPDHMAGITDAAQQGRLIPKIGRTVPLADAIEALTELETTGRPRGRLVITFDA